MFRELAHLAGQVYLYPCDAAPNAMQPNIGIIKSKKQTILVDAGNSPHHARQILMAMAGQDFAPVETIIYTHHHWDHTFGASTYNATQIIAHSNNAHHMNSYANKTWNHTALREEMYINPHLRVRNEAISVAIPDWRDFRICTPKLTFSNRLTLYLDELRLELQVISGGRHADDSIVVRVPQAGVIFLGDCYYPPPAHMHVEGDDALSISILESLIDEAYQIYVDGHGAPRRYAEFITLIQQEKARQASDAL